MALDWDTPIVHIVIERNSNLIFGVFSTRELAQRSLTLSCSEDPDLDSESLFDIKAHAVLNHVEHL